MRSQDAVIRLYDAAGNVIETHEHAGDFKRAVSWLVPGCLDPVKSLPCPAFLPVSR